jgi:hypothetical protein
MSMMDSSVGSRKETLRHRNVCQVRPFALKKRKTFPFIFDVFADQERKRGGPGHPFS